MMKLTERVANFALQHHRPFSPAQAAEYLNVREDEINSAIEELLTRGDMKRLSKSQAVLVSAHRWETHDEKRTLSLDLQQAESFCTALEQNEVRSCRALSRLCCCSHTVAYLYLEAFVSIGVAVKRPARAKLEKSGQFGSRVARAIIEKLRGCDWVDAKTLQKRVAANESTYDEQFRRLRRKGFISYEPARYIVIDRNRLIYLGSDIKKGCLRRVK